MGIQRCVVRVISDTAHFLCVEVTDHAISKLTSNKIESHDREVMVKLCIKNAFDSDRRDIVLDACLDRTLEIDKLAFIAYSKSSSVIASGYSIASSSGVQQGDPIGPHLFTLAVDQIASGVQSGKNVWYLDDSTIGGSTESDLSDVMRCITELKRIGLEVNTKKAEIINVGLADGDYSRVVDSFSILS